VEKVALPEHSFGRGRRPEGPTGVGKVGNPRGIKENVIMGRLIPAGTGLPAYKKLQVVIDEKSPTYAPPTYARVQPADLVAVGDE
jgi:DNA-directed RNA polymerase subunit beta'